MKNFFYIFTLIVLVLLTEAVSSCQPSSKNDSNNRLKNEILTPAEVEKLIKAGIVKYSDFKAKGDGITNDMGAIVATHAFANKNNLKVKADDGATYYIGPEDRTATIKTNTDFGTAKFIIDDSNVSNRSSFIFSVEASEGSFKLGEYAITSLKKGQTNIGIRLPAESIAFATNTGKRQYIRYGVNHNDGTPQSDLFIVDKDGNIDITTPVIWDFENVTDLEFRIIDKKPITISGGEFTTIANVPDNKYTNRGFSIKRSNVVIKEMKHFIKNESSEVAPYNGFLNITTCSNIKILNCTFTGHIPPVIKGIRTGSYDITISKTINVEIIDCKQTNDINNAKFWGLMGTNFCKNITLKNCVFSRFDAHQGVYNTTISGCSLGWQGVSIIGSGELLVENSTINGSSMVNLRSDYGSTWEGSIKIKDCIFIPKNKDYASIIGGFNNEQHDFGYICYMPESITIENLYIDDSKQSVRYSGPSVFGDFNKNKKDNTYVVKYPYIITKDVYLKNVKSSSGKELILSYNKYMFKDVVIHK